VGDTGPGGGKIFYVAGGTFTSTGSACNTNGAGGISTCKYLEAAPTSGTNAWTDARYAWSGNTSVEIGTTARGTAIGTGYANTLAIVGQAPGGNTADRAATKAHAYRGPNNLTDWYLPSKDELNQLYVARTTVGGFEALGTYWSSSEDSATNALSQYFGNGIQDSNTKGSPTVYVRPVRAFFGPPIVISVAAIAGVTAPVTGATPVTTTTDGTGYTGVVTWTSSSGALVGNFAGATIYTATITLTATSGYTLTGVSENFFTVAGATTDTNPANSGVITAVFPSTLAALTCATGGTCSVGDTGPGGGKVFYVATTPFACGPTGSETCRYLEAAPNTWSEGSSDPIRTWATNIYSNQSTAVTGADGTAIGTGYKNSLEIVAQTGNVAASSAAVAARAYRGPNNLSDWFLPSKDELAQLYSQKATVGGFVPSDYWSSSEGSASIARTQGFDAKGNQGFNDKHGTSYLRPVRAF
jgi:hypothetical protein